jgi:hypothetical protein
MTLDYSSETPLRQFVPDPSLLSWVRLRSGQVKLFNFRVRLSNLWQYADGFPSTVQSSMSFAFIISTVR